MKKKLKICVTILLTSIAMQSIVLAMDETSYSIINDKLGVILNAIAWVGYTIALGMVIYIGIKYTMASANDKANLKQGVINYLIGACLIICASAISNIVAISATGGATDDANSMAKNIIDSMQDAAGSSLGSLTKITRLKSNCTLEVDMKEFKFNATIKMKNDDGTFTEIGYTTETGGYNIYSNYIDTLKEGTTILIVPSYEDEDEEAKQINHLTKWSINGTEIASGKNGSIEFVLSDNTIVTPIYEETKLVSKDTSITLTDNKTATFETTSAITTYVVANNNEEHKPDYSMVVGEEQDRKTITSGVTAEGEHMYQELTLSSDENISTKSIILTMNGDAEIYPDVNYITIYEIDRETGEKKELAITDGDEIDVEKIDGEVDVGKYIIDKASIGDNNQGYKIYGNFDLQNKSYAIVVDCALEK